MSQKMRSILQVFFLLVFLALLLTGRIQVWMAVTFLSIILAVLLGRFYCSFICPIFTAARVTEKMRKLCKKKAAPVPTFTRSPYLRPLILALFAAAVFVSLFFKIGLPLFPVLIVIAAVLALFFVPSFWHRYLCPLGVLFSITSRPARIYLYVDQEHCSGCGLCEKKCPGAAVQETGQNGEREIQRKHCLLCFICRDVCPQGAIALASAGRAGISQQGTMG